MSNQLNDVFENPAQAQNIYDANEKLTVNVDLSLCAPEEMPRMIHIVNRLAQSEAGRETLEIAAKENVSFGFLDAKSDCFGCAFGFGAVGLSPTASDDKLVSTLCHECRHIGQNARMKTIPERDELNVASIIKASRAKEADAQAYALKACKELEMQGDAGPLQTFGKFYPEIYAAYEKAFAEEGEMNNKVVAATFKGWYDQKYTKQAYEEGYIIEPMHEALAKYDQGKTDGVYTFAKSVPSSKVVAKIGWTKNGNYLAGEDPKFLDNPKFLSISERTKSDAQAYFALRKEKTGLKADASVNKMPTYKDAYKSKLPEMGQPVKDEQQSMNMKPTIEKWNAILSAKGIGR